MNIKAITFQTNSQFNKTPRTNKTNNTQQLQTPPVTTGFAYRDYNISFGARLNRSPENFQEFNSDNMPFQMRQYLLADFENRKHIHPTELQKEAYRWIEAANTVDDIKDAYKDEPLFANLKSVKNTKATRGFLYKLRVLGLNTQEPIFKKEFDEQNKDDLTVYFVKKIYLEGKTLKEINADFKKEAKPEVLDLLEEKDGITYAILDSLGVKFPKLAYWNSFQATRADKDYTPSKRNNNYYKEFEKEAAQNAAKQEREVSQETIEKLSASSKKWWANLTPEEKAEQLRKMRQGKELSNSAFSKFQSQIQTLAGYKTGYSERLVQIFSEEYTDEELSKDDTKFAGTMRTIMNRFWNEDPDFRVTYTNALNETLQEFEAAYNDTENPQALENLLTKAIEAKNEILQKSIERRKARLEEKRLKEEEKKKIEEQARAARQEQLKKPEAPEKSFNINSPKEVKREFKSRERTALRIYPEVFQKEYLGFLMDEKNVSLATMKKFVAQPLNMARQVYNLNDETMQDFYKDLQDNVEKINAKFNSTHILVAKTNDFIINNALYELTHNPAMFKKERGDANIYIEEHKLQNAMLARKESFNKDFKILCRPLSEKNAGNFTTNIFIPEMKKVLARGFEYYPELKLDFAHFMLNQIKQIHAQNPAEIRDTIKFITNYNAAIKFYLDNDNDERAKKAIMEHIVIDYLTYFSKKHEKLLLNKMF